jgi:DNA (cytosine-5)-methyltransferase 1
MKVVDLFAGIGGLSYGFEYYNCNVISYEMNKICTAVTKKRHETICTTIDENTKIDNCDILIGGPPCQPFSKAGSQKGNKDIRDQIPIYIHHLRKLRPKAFLMENVENLASRHGEYFDWILSKMKKIGYKIFTRVLDCSYYDVPQKRKRLFIVGFLDDVDFTWPRERGITVVSDYMDKENCKFYPELKIDDEWEKRIEKYEKSSKSRPRDIYFDEPCRTLTCKNLCAKTNDVIRLKLPEGRRMLTVREACIIQTIPYNWMKNLEYKDAMKCIGNSVPPLMSRKLAKCILRCLD